MKIIGIGNDIIEVERVRKAIESTEGFLNKIFTEDEVAYFKNKKMNYETIAGNFCTKEAVVKALGTGFINIDPIDIEILRNQNGKPIVKFLKNGYNNIKVNVSISHIKEYATAVALAYCEED